MELSRNEILCIADICNPGFEHEEPALVACSLKASVWDTLLDLFPGSYGDKWDIDEVELIRKLSAASDAQVLKLAEAITRFWNNGHDANAEDILATAAEEIV